MANKINVTHVVFRDGTSEELRGYDHAEIKEGLLVALWEHKEIVMYPLDTIKNITMVEEEE